MTNTLGKKLADLQREKVDLENQLEQEEEFITNKLHKQLSTVLEEKKVLEKRLEEEGNLFLSVSLSFLFYFPYTSSFFFFVN